MPNKYLGVGFATAVADNIPAATVSVLGGVKPDGTTVTNVAGVISVTYGTTALTSVQGNDSRIIGALSTTAAASTYLTITNASSTYAPLASPTFTGTANFAGISASGAGYLGSLTINEVSTSSVASLTVNAASDTNGVNLKLLGNGATTPSKTIKVINGVFNIVNDAYTTNLFSMTDAGVITLASALPILAGGTGSTTAAAALTALGGLSTTTAASTYAPRASPSLTGTPVTVAPTVGNSTLQIATTQFVTVGAALKANIAAPTFTGNTTASGQFISAGGFADSSYSLQTPVTGFSITVANNVTTLQLTPAGTLASGTVIMPLSPVNGSWLFIASTQNITTFTVSPNTAQTIRGAPTTLLAYSEIMFQYQGTVWTCQYGNDSRIIGALSTTAAAATYAPLASPTFTGTASINYTGNSGALVVNYNGNNAAGVAIAQTSTSYPGYSLICSVWLSISYLCLWEYQGTPVGSVTTNGSSVAYNTTSDHRLKVLHSAADASAFFGKLPVYDAEMKFGQPRPMFLAHEVATVFPDAVRGEKDGMQSALDFEGAPRLDINGDQYEVPLYQMVDHLMLIPAMWAMIDALNARLAVLEGRPK